MRLYQALTRSPSATGVGTEKFATPPTLTGLPASTASWATEPPTPRKPDVPASDRTRSHVEPLKAMGTTARPVPPETVPGVTGSKTDVFEAPSLAVVAMPTETTC